MKIISNENFHKKYGDGRGRGGGYGTPTHDVKALTALMDYFKPGRCVEIGCNTGATSNQLLCDNDYTHEYIGIDLPKIWFVNEPAGHMAQRHKGFNLIQREGGVRGVDPDEIGKVDFVFIDGDHSLTGVSHDTQWARRVIRDGGVIVWHDCGCQDCPEVLEYIESVDDGYFITKIEGTYLCFEIEGCNGG